MSTLHPFASPFSARKTCFALCAVGVLVGSAAAQSRWVVDLQNRPGTDFTDLPAAVAAAATGDILFLREQTSMAYTPPTTIAKGLSLIGETGVGGPPAILGELRFENVPNGDITLTNLQLGIGAFNGGLTLVNCAGVVATDGVASWGDSLLTIDNCPFVAMRGFTATTSAVGHTVRSSVLFAQDCYFGAFQWLAVTPPALVLERSTVQFTRSQAVGSLSALQPSVAVSLFRSTLVLDTNSDLLGSPSDVLGGPQSLVRFDPGANMGAGVTAAGPVAVRSEAIASLTASELVRGRNADFQVFAGPQEIAFLGLGFASTQPVAVVGVGGAVWLNSLLGIDTVGFAFTNAQGTASFALPVPNSTSLLDGVAFSLQAAVFSAATGQASLTNPVTAVLR